MNYCREFKHPFAQHWRLPYHIYEIQPPNIIGHANGSKEQSPHLLLPVETEAAVSETYRSRTHKPIKASYRPRSVPRPPGYAAWFSWGWSSASARFCVQATCTPGRGSQRKCACRPWQPGCHRCPGPRSHRSSPCFRHPEESHHWPWFYPSGTAKLSPVQRSRETGQRGQDIFCLCFSREVLLNKIGHRQAHVFFNHVQSVILVTLYPKCT